MQFSKDLHKLIMHSIKTLYKGGEDDVFFHIKRRLNFNFILNYDFCPSLLLFIPHNSM